MLLKLQEFCFTAVVILSLILFGRFLSWIQYSSALRKPEKVELAFRLSTMWRGFSGMVISATKRK